MVVMPGCTVHVDGAVEDITGWDGGHLQSGDRWRKERDPE